MATEPTLGVMILDAADQWAEAAEVGDFAAQEHATGRLRALAARADAAERLAVASVGEEDAWADHEDSGGSVSAGAYAIALAAESEHEDARAAWRAITEGVGG